MIAPGQNACAVGIYNIHAIVLRNNSRLTSRIAPPIPESSVSNHVAEVMPVIGCCRSEKLEERLSAHLSSKFKDRNFTILVFKYNMY